MRRSPACFPAKSGGASVYGATAWVRYGKLLAPLSVWCNWLAWSPVLAIGCGIAAGYVLTSLFAADSAVRSWEITLLDLGALKKDFKLRINATFVVGVILLLITFAVQHRGILQTARVQTVIGIAVVVPLLIIGLVPLITGDVVKANLTPLLPLAGTDAAGDPIAGEWNKAGWTVFFGGLFLAAWSTYAFETAICYTNEFKNPRVDTFKAIFASGLLCLVIFSLVPLAFQGTLGLKAMLDPAIYDGSGVAAAMARMVGGGAFIGALIVVMLILAVILSIITAMAGSSRTLYQGSIDGWLPKYLSRLNAHGAPTHAMCHQPGVQSSSAADIGLRVRACGFQLLLHFIQLSELARRLDPSHRQCACRASVARAQLAAGGRRGAGVRECVSVGRRRPGLRRGHARHRHHRRSVGHTGVPVSPLCGRQRRVPAADAGRVG